MAHDSNRNKLIKNILMSKYGHSWRYAEFSSIFFYEGQNWIFSTEENEKGTKQPKSIVIMTVIGKFELKQMLLILTATFENFHRLWLLR